MYKDGFGKNREGDKELGVRERGNEETQNYGPIEREQERRKRIRAIKKRHTTHTHTHADRHADRERE